MKKLMFVLALAAVVGFALPVLAQEEGGGEKKEDKLGMREQMTLRMLEGMLGLSADQKEKLTKTLIKMTKTTNEEIRKHLTDDQKKKYDDVLKQQREREARWGERMRGFGGRMGRSGRGGRGGGMPGMGGMRGGMRIPGMRGMGDINQWMKDMKERLKLDDKQFKKIEEILSKMMEEAMGKFAEKFAGAFGQGGGRPDFRKILKELKPEIDKFMDEAAKKIKKELREDQLPEFEKMMKELKEQIDAAMSGRRSSRGDRGGRRDYSARRLERILEDLKLPAEEAEILKPKIESILKAQSENQKKFYELSTEMRKLMGSETDSATVKAKLDEFRAKRAEYEAALKTLQEELRELLTYEQEAKLVLHRVLE